jgi:hypothetical protein
MYLQVYVNERGKLLKLRQQIHLHALQAQISRCVPWEDEHMCACDLCCVQQPSCVVRLHIVG